MRQIQVVGMKGCGACDDLWKNVRSSLKPGMYRRHLFSTPEARIDFLREKFGPAVAPTLPCPFLFFTEMVSPPSPGGTGAHRLLHANVEYIRSGLPSTVLQRVNGAALEKMTRPVLRFSDLSNKKLIANAEATEQRLFSETRVGS